MVADVAAQACAKGLVEKQFFNLRRGVAQQYPQGPKPCGLTAGPLPFCARQGLEKVVLDPLIIAALDSAIF